MNKEISNRITNLNFILLVMIVIMHSSCYRFLNAEQALNLSITHSIIHTILQVAVPLFFSISAYLLYRNLNEKNLRRKIKNRFKSLLIPFIIWGLLFFTYYKIISILPGVGSFADMNMDLSIKTMPKNLILGEFFHTGWFIRNLIIYTAFCPLILFVRNKTKNKVDIPILLGLITLTIVLKSGYSNPLYFSAMYYLGVIASSFSNRIETTPVNNKRNMVVLLLIETMVTILCSFISQDSILFYMYRFISILLIMLLIFNTKALTSTPRKITHCAFLMMITHVAFIQIINRAFITFFGIDEMKSILYSILSTIISVSLVYLLHMLLNKVFPKIYSLLTGGRG